MRSVKGADNQKTETVLKNQRAGGTVHLTPLKEGDTNKAMSRHRSLEKLDTNSCDNGNTTVQKRVRPQSFGDKIVQNCS